MAGDAHHVRVQVLQVANLLELPHAGWDAVASGAQVFRVLDENPHYGTKALLGAESRLRRPDGKVDEDVPLPGPLPDFVASVREAPWMRFVAAGGRSPRLKK